MSDPNPGAPQPDGPSINPPGPIDPVEPEAPAEPDPTPDEPTFPAEDGARFDDTDPNPPTEQFIPGSFN